MYRKFILIFVATAIYATVRYNVFGNFPWTDWPMFIVNKAISFTMTVLLFYATMNYYSTKTDLFEKWLSFIKKLSTLHILLSLVLLSQQYYPKILEQNKFSFFGNMMLLSGSFAALLLFSKLWKKYFFIFILILSLHLFFLGIKGWLKPETWYGSMPPITLICFILIMISFGILVYKSYKQREN